MSQSTRLAPSLDATVPPDETVIELLSRLEAQALELRRTAAELGKANVVLCEDPSGAAPWLSTYLHPGVATALGSALMSMSVTQGWIAELAQAAIGGVANGGSAGAIVDRLADDMARGVTDSALLCPCGSCPGCRLIEEKGVSQATAQILRDARKGIVIPKKLRHGGGLVDGHGRPLG